MADSKITIGLEVDTQEALQSVDEVKGRLNQVKEEASKRLSVSSSILPGFDEDMGQQVRILQANLDEILKTRERIERSSTSFDKQNLIERYKDQVKAAQKSMDDLFDAKNMAKTFVANLSKELKGSGFSDSLKQEFTQGMTGIASALKNGLRQATSSLVEASWSAQDDQHIVEMFMKSAAYKNTVRPLQQKNAELFSDKVMERYLKTSLFSAVPQYQRTKVSQSSLDRQANATRAESIREMLPSAFAGMAIRPQEIQRKTRQEINDTNGLTEQERQALFRLVQANRYAADNAVKAGIIQKENGRMYYNPNTTRAMVNSMGSYAMRDFEIGARGEAKYGITNVEDPTVFRQIARKSNKRITSSMNTMEAMQDAFPWLKPTYYSDDMPYTGYTGKNGEHVNGVYIGRIHHSPKPESRSFAEYTLDMMENGWQINGRNPIINGQVFKDVTKPQVIERFEDEGGNIVVKPEDWHTITKRRSMEQDILERTLAGSKPGHNDFSDNAIYLKIDERLADPHLSDEEREQYRERYAKLFREGYTVNGQHYVNTRFNNTHAEFVKEDIIKELGGGDLEAGRRLFLVEGSDKPYTSRSKAAKAMYNQNTMDTEGESLEEFMGVGKDSPFKVVVADFSKIGYPGLDGVNLINDRRVSQSFQGRMLGDKSTFSKFNMSGLRKLYSNLIDPTTGDLIIPGAGVGGGDLIIPKDTDLIENVQNIKAMKTGDLYSNMTQDQINAHRTEQYRKYGIYAKTTYDDAATEGRWMSHQLVNAMNGAFNDPEINKYFQDVLFDEVAKLDNEQYVRKLLFKDDQDLDLNSDYAQSRINNYRSMLFERYGKGDRLLPEGVSTYSMAAPYLPNVINKAIQDAGGTLTNEQLEAQIGEDAVVALKDFAEKVGIIRYPATIGGNISAANMANDPRYGDKIRLLSKQLGMDPEGLYFVPGSKIMEAMQTEDFDGDINKLFHFGANVDPKFNSVVEKMFSLAQAENEKIIELSGRSQDSQAQLKEKRTVSTTAKDEEEGRTYSLLNPDDKASILVEAQRAAAKMGVANSIGVNAWQYGLNRQTARALRDSEDHYDVVSTWAKMAEDYEMSDAEKKMLYGGAAFSQLFNWASKAASATGEGEDSVKVWDDASQQLFNQRNIDAVNLPSFHVGATMATLGSRFIARNRGQQINGVGPNGEPLYDWDKIFANLPEIENPNSATGRMTQRLRQVKADIMNGKYIGIGESLEDELMMLSMASRAELEKQYDKKEANAKFKAAGGEVIANMGRMGITERSIRSNPEALEQMVQLQTLFPLANVYGQGQPIPEFTEAKIEEAKKEKELLEKEIEVAKQDLKEQTSKIEERTEKPINFMDELRKAEDAWKEQEQYVTEDKYINGKEFQDYKAEVHRNFLMSALKDQTGIDISEREMQNILDNQNRSNVLQNQVAEKTNYIGLGENALIGFQKYVQAQEEFSQLADSVGEFSQGLWSMIRKNEARMSGLTNAELYYDKNSAIANQYARRLEAFKDTEAFQTLSVDQQNRINNWLGVGDGKSDSLKDLVNKDFADSGLYFSQKLLESLTQANDKTAGIVDPQMESLNAFTEKLKEAAVYRDKLLTLSQDEKTSDTLKDRFKADAESVDDYINKSKDQLKQLQLSMQDVNVKSFDKEISKLENNFKPKKDISVIAEQYKNAIQEIRNSLEQKHTKGLISDEVYNEDIKRLDELSKKSTEMALTVSNAFNKFGSVINRAISQFGHRMFRQAMQEARRFVQEYDKDMTTIQMITLKSDSEIGDLGQNLIQKAVDMRASVSETTSAAAELYRQGLSDEEVDTRLEDVIKFSKVAGIKTTEASKIITTALQNGLVDTSEEAMDALVALGDSAATTASEIAKGMQKTAASAKQAGVSYSQLVTLLTIGTSKTQLGGSAIGSALQTLFYRLQKVGKNEDFYDENGRHIASNDAMKAMEGLGVSAFDDAGNMRNPYDVLVDIASRWDTADDVTQSKLLTSLGAGRQRSNVATLLQGLSEDNGELANKYNNLASNSEGITDKKYQEYLKSLEAAITNVRTSFDQLISTFNAGATASTVLNFLATLIQGFTKVNDMLGGIPTLLSAIGVAAAGLIALFKFSNPIGWLSVGIGAAVAAVSGIGVGVKAIEDSIYKNSDEYKKKQEKERLETEYQRKLTLNSGTLSYSPIIEESKQLGKEYEKLGKEMDETKLAKFESNLRSLVEIFPELGSNISDNVDILDSWKDIVDGAALSAEKIIQIKNLEATKDITDSNVKDVADQLQKELDEIDKISKSRDKISEFSRDDIHFDSQLTGNLEGPYEGEKKDVELTIADLRAELQALSDEFSNLSIANIPVNEDASKFVESMTNLISALDGMPKDGYDFSSLQNLDLNQLSSQAVNIESAIKAIDDAVANNVISQETANAMKAPLEQALTSLQNKIDEFNEKNKVNTVGYHVEDDSDVAMSNIGSIPDGPDGKGFDDASIHVENDADVTMANIGDVPNGPDGKGYDDASIHVKNDSDETKKEIENVTSGPYATDVHVNNDADVTMHEIDKISDGLDGTGYDDAFISVKNDAYNTKQEIEAVANGPYEALVKVHYDFGSDKPEEGKPTQTEVQKLQEEINKQSQNTVVQQTYTVPNAQIYSKPVVGQPLNNQTISKPFVPNVNGLSPEGAATLDKLEQEKARLTNFWKSFTNELIKDPEHNIESVLDKLNTTKDDLIKAINTNITMDKYLDIEATMSDIQEILDAFFQLSTTVGEVKNNRYSSMAFNIKNAPRLAGVMSDVSRGPAPSNNNHIVADEALKPSVVNWLDDNFYKTISGIDPTGKFYNGLKNVFASLGVNIEDYSSNAKTLFGLSEDPTKRDISLNGIYKQQIENMQGENSPYYYLLASKPNEFYQNRRIASVNELDYSIDDPETIAATKDILTYLYEYVLPNDKNYNKSSYKNLDEFLADWDNQEGSFKNFAFTSDSDVNQDALSYISSYFDKITDKDSSEYDNYQKYIKSKIDAAVKSAFDQLFGTDSSGNSIIKAFDQLDNGETLKGVIKGIIETQHTGQSYSDWINTDNLNEVVSLVDKEILEYVQDPDKYIQNKATEAFKQDPTNLVKTAIGMFDEVNGSKNTADTLFKQIQEAIKGGSVSNLSDVFKLFSEGNIFEDLSTVLMDDKKGVLGQILKEFTDEDANIIDENGVGLKQFLIALASLTGAYTDAANEILPQIADNAKNYLTSRNETLYSDFSSLVGSSLAIKYKTGETLSPIESDYMNTIIGNAANGMSGLTELQQYEGMRRLFELANSGNFDYNSIDSKVMSAYTSGSKELDNYLAYSSKLSESGLDASKLGDIEPLTEEYKKYDDILRKAGTTAHAFIETQKELNKELAVNGVNATNAYGNRTKEVTSIMANIKGSVEEVSQEQQNLNKILTSISNNQYWRNKWKAGDRSDETLKGIASMLNIPQDQIDQWGKKYINAMLESLEITDMSSIKNYTDALSETIELELNEAAKKPIVLEATGIELYGGEVSYNFTEALAKLNGIIDKFEYEILAQLATAGVDGIVNIFTDKEGNIHARIEPKTLGRGRANGRLSSNNSNKNGNNGGNGNNNKKEKTPAEALTEAIKNRKSLWDHRIKMVQFEQTYYEQDDQLGNYGRMLEAENQIRREMGPALEQNLRDLQAELSQTAQNTKEWYSLRDAILEAEEAIEDNNNAIEANNKKLKQNEYEIHKRRVDLENLVRDEIKRRIEEHRNQVKGASDLENEILNIIKERYRSQWDRQVPTY